MIKFDSSKASIVIIDPTISFKVDKHFHCTYCGKWLFSMNRKFAVTSHGGVLLAGVEEIPLSVFRLVRRCSDCLHYYVIYFDGKSPDL